MPIMRSADSMKQVKEANKMMNNTSAEGKNKGVHCEVSACYYHTEGRGCDATVIDIGPTNACSCKETACATFREK